MMSQDLLHISDLKVHFPVRGGILSRTRGSVKAVDGVSLQIKEGETLGLVGESGCGKSTLGKAILRLVDPTSGVIQYAGRNITQLKPRQMLPIRERVQMVFQDPSESLDPRMSVGELLMEPLVIYGKGNAVERKQWVAALLDRVGLPAKSIDKFPHEFSGGQRQRVGIARALALNPKLIVLDEPVSALDVSVQSQVLNLLRELQVELGLSYLFIAHDLAVVKHLSDRVAVMYLGKIVETAHAQDLYKDPRHAYTKALIDSIPVPDPTQKRESVIVPGEVPSPLNPPAGSAFGHRMNHPKYEETIGMEMMMGEIAPDHFVVADPCCVSEEDYKAIVF